MIAIWRGFSSCVNNPAREDLMVPHHPCRGNPPWLPFLSASTAACRCCVFAILVFLATLLSEPPRVSAAGPVRVGVPSPSVSYFPAIVSWKKGFFAQEGIQVEFIVMKPSIIPAAMTNGEIQFSTATGLRVIQTQALGAKVSADCLFYLIPSGVVRDREICGSELPIPKRSCAVRSRWLS